MNDEMTLTCSGDYTTEGADPDCELHGGADFVREYEGLRRYGYAPIASIKGISVGDRVHHVGETYPDAYRDGTATVLAILERGAHPGRQDRDIELLVRRDHPVFTTSTIGQWADYHTCAAR